MSTAPVMTDRFLPALVLIFLALVLFAVGLVNRLQSPTNEMTLGSLGQEPAVLSCVIPRCASPTRGGWSNA